MSIYASNNNYILYNGKMQEELKNLPDESIDSIICDPPYDLTTMTKRCANGSPIKYGEDGSFQRLSKGFMGKTWDGTGVAFDPSTWKECLRVLKPGGYLLAFGGTRTFHRMAVAIEDAGFEIRDTIMWLYGSGFPKSHDIGKAVDSEIRYGKSNTITNRINEQENGGEEYIVKQTNNGCIGETHNVVKKEYCANNEWSGFGTALKPAYEPIIMARKPMNCSVAQNCLKYGVGAINIDECRVYGENISCHNTKSGTFAGKTQTVPKFASQGNKLSFGQYEEKADRIEYTQHEGRFPANVITDGSDEVASGMPINSSSSRDGTPSNCDSRVPFIKSHKSGVHFEDSGSAMRYFYSAKVSKKDRDEGLDAFELSQRTDGCIRANSESARKFGANSGLAKNTHPTVKPVELMQYLVRLVSPKDATILDPFMGSGSTGKAVMFENRERNANYKFIGVEMTDEYLPIAQARIDYALNKYEYDRKKIEKETGQIALF